MRTLAFYLPQFHPVPENDQWWGPGFTEWTNVTRARSQRRGHRQPRLPADLGFYDLRLPEIRIAQAALAAAHGVDAFCYYHYWFEGRRLLDRPFDDVRQSGEPDFPFCLCWANENWTRTWSGNSANILVEQAYSPTDDLNHIRWLASVFADPRYVQVDGRPLFLVYRPSAIPNPRRTTDLWRQEAVRLGVGEPYLCAVHALPPDRVDPRALGFDAAVLFAPDWRSLGPSVGSSMVRRSVRKVFNPSSALRRHRFCHYDEVVRLSRATPAPEFKRYPCVCPGFDNTPRRPERSATVLVGSSPERYGRWLADVLDEFEPFGADEDLVFVNSWNEWGEGSQLEPCSIWGTAYLQAHLRAVQDNRGRTQSHAGRDDAAHGIRGRTGRPEDTGQDRVPPQHVPRDRIAPDRIEQEPPDPEGVTIKATRPL